jgi:hypothetical protein
MEDAAARLPAGRAAPYATGEEFFIPLASAVRHETQHNGGMSCNANLGPGFAARLASECTWITAWFETAAPATAPSCKAGSTTTPSNSASWAA